MTSRWHGAGQVALAEVRDVASCAMVLRLCSWTRHADHAALLEAMEQQSVSVSKVSAPRCTPCGPLPVLVLERLLETTR